MEEIENLPNAVCADCCKKLLEFSQFREIFLRTQIELANRALIKMEILEDDFGHDENIVVDTLDFKEPKVEEIEPIVEYKSTGSSNVKYFYCSESGCTDKFLKRKTLDEHMRKHQGLKPLVCPTCNKGFSKNIILLRHQEKVHGEKQQKFECLYAECDGLKFRSQKTYKSHVAEVHEKKKKEKAVKYKCPFDGCDKSFLKEKNLIGHKLTHQGLKSFPCSQCDRAYKKEPSLKQHVFEMHETSEPRYTCDYCGKRFWSKDLMRVHFKVIHLPKDNVPTKHCICDICGKSISTPFQLKVGT
jgi:uncharacterized Zn-finger protein